MPFGDHDYTHLITTVRQVLIKTRPKTDVAFGLSFDGQDWLFVSFRKQCQLFIGLTDEKKKV